jgi:hypothetical protein
MSGLWLVSYVVLWALFLVVVALLAGALHHIGILYGRIEKKLPTATRFKSGEMLPDLVLKSPAGEPVPVSSFSGSQTAFVIVGPGCSNCLRVLEKLADGDAFMQLPVEKLVVVSLRDIPGTVDLVQRARLPPTFPVLVDTEEALDRLWGVRTTPVVVEVDGQMKIERQRVVLD